MTPDDLKKLVSQIGTYEAAARIISRNAGYEATKKASVHYWVTREGELPPRAEQAGKILQNHLVPTTLGKIRIAHPNCLWVLPSVLAVQRLNQHRSEAEIEAVDGGAAAIRLLKRGRVDIAFAARELYDTDDASCRAVCRVMNGRVIGFSSQPVDFIQDLVECEIFYPKDSFIADRISSTCLREGLPGPVFVGCATADDVNTALRSRSSTKAASEKNFAVVGWDTFAIRSKKLLKGAQEWHDVSGAVLGELESYMGVNLKRIDADKARTISVYIRLLDEAAREIAKSKSSETFYRDISDRLPALNLSSQDVQLSLKHCRFGVGPVDLEFFLTLSQRLTGSN